MLIAKAIEDMATPWEMKWGRLPAHGLGMTELIPIYIYKNSCSERDFREAVVFLMCVKKAGILGKEGQESHCRIGKSPYLCSVKKHEKALKSGATG